jgi:hypothetical protein
VELTVTRAVTAADRAAVFAFRYRVYVDEMGVETPEADHDRQWLTDPLDDHAELWVLGDGDRVLGSLRIAYLDDVPDLDWFVDRFSLEPALDAFGPAALCATSRFMLDPQLRLGTAILRLMVAPVQSERAGPVRLNYGDCSPHMLPFYVHMGYRRYAPGFNDVRYGFKVPIVMLMGDRDRFTRVRSPFARLLRDRPDDPGARDWFARTYPDHLGIRSARFVDGAEFHDLVAAQIGGQGIETLPPFLGFTREDVLRFLGDTTLVTLQPGDRVVRQGERGDAMYVSLSGALAVVRTSRQTADAGEERISDLVAPGELFGEAAFLSGRPRTASIVAGAPSEVLVLPGDAIRRWQHKDPALYATFMTNVARILVDRLTLAPSGADAGPAAG